MQFSRYCPFLVLSKYASLYHIVTAATMLELAVAELSSDFFDNGAHHSTVIAAISSIIYASYAITLPCTHSLCVSIAASVLIVIQKRSGVEPLIRLYYHLSYSYSRFAETFYRASHQGKVFP